VDEHSLDKITSQYDECKRNFKNARKADKLPKPRKARNEDSENKIPSSASTGSTWKGWSWFPNKPVTYRKSWDLRYVNEDNYEDYKNYYEKGTRSAYSDKLELDNKSRAEGRRRSLRRKKEISTIRRESAKKRISKQM